MAQIKEGAKDKIKEIREQIKINSKDAHFGEKLANELVTEVKKTKNHATLLDVGKEERKIKGETFELTKTDRGILYHTYGGYSIFVTPNNSSLYDLLNDYIENDDVYNKLEGKEKEDFLTTLSAVTYCLNVPLVVFTNSDLTYKIALDVVEYLRKIQEEMLNSELQEETIDEDRAFQDATIALENIKEEIKSEHIED